jgi:hypothetical protein
MTSAVGGCPWYPLRSARSGSRRRHRRHVDCAVGFLVSATPSPRFIARSRAPAPRRLGTVTQAFVPSLMCCAGVARITPGLSRMEIVASSGFLRMSCPPAAKGIAHWATAPCRVGALPCRNSLERRRSAQHFTRSAAESLQNADRRVGLDRWWAWRRRSVEPGGGPARSGGWRSGAPVGQGQIDNPRSGGRVRGCLAPSPTTRST